MRERKREMQERTDVAEGAAALKISMEDAAAPWREGGMGYKGKPRSTLPIRTSLFRETLAMRFLTRACSGVIIRVGGA